MNYVYNFHFEFVNYVYIISRFLTCVLYFSVSKVTKLVDQELVVVVVMVDPKELTGK